MADQQTPMLSTANVKGAPLSTVGGFGLGALQYIAGQGLQTPQDALGWVQLVAWLLVTILGALGRAPQAPTARMLISFLLLSIGLTGTQAQAFSKELKASGFAVPASGCSGCTREPVTPASNQPQEVMTIPSGGGYVLGTMQFPTEATGPILTFRVLSMREADVSGNDNFCTQICAGVILEGELASALDISACTLASSDAATDQWSEFEADFTAIGLTPKHVGGSACSGTACNGGLLVIKLIRVASGSCTTGSTDNSGYQTVIPYFQ